MWVIVGSSSVGGRGGVVGGIKSFGTSRDLDREQFWTMILGCRGLCTAVALRMCGWPAIFVEVEWVGVGCRHSCWVYV